jgi:AraC family transcriptional regulator
VIEVLELLYGVTGEGFLAKIAVEVERALARRAVSGSRGDLAMRVLAQGDGWAVRDVICTSGPRDRPFEERHAQVQIAIVAAGSFQYRSAVSARRALMTPGSLLLGNAGQCFECGHDHGAGDRCVSFSYRPEYFDRLAADAGRRVSGRRGREFRAPRVPPMRALSPLVARVCTALADVAGPAGSAGPAGGAAISWEELSVQLAARVVEIESGHAAEASRTSGAPPNAEARVTRIVRAIERLPEARLPLGSLAREADLSPYHFLRTFTRLTGVTPHQYILRTRLREAAMRLAADKPATVLDVALDCGFGDLSNFIRAFRHEFGVSPRVYRSYSSYRSSSQVSPTRSWPKL